jgi:hypothetical protein
MIDARLNADVTERRPPVFAISLLLAGALAYEVLLMRLFSIVQWHHFAYMVISLALLGYGVSGTFLSLTQQWLLRRFDAAFCINLGLFGVASVACYLLAQRVPFNAEAVLWDLRQPLRLLIMYLLLATPFFFAANAVALAFIGFRGQIARVYAADLFGAGLGSLSVIVLLLLQAPLPALGIVGALGMASLLVAVWQLRTARRVMLSVAAIGAALALVLITQHAKLELSPYKDLNQILRIAGTRIVSESSGPLGLLSVVESKQAPLRHAPGLSLMAPDEPPEQVAVFSDGAGMTAINDGNADPKAYRYLDQLTWSLPYHLAAPRKVLVLGAGGGTEVLQARRYGAADIDAVELNPQMIDLVRGPYGDFSGHLYSQTGVHVHAAEARGFVATGADRYDLIQLPLLDSFAASAAGLYALNESYLYTVEALSTFIEHLNPDGYLAISRWINLPPRDMLKLFATAAAALQQMGVTDPGERLILIRGWQTGTLLIKNGAVTPGDVDMVRRFAAARAFDVCWFPDIRADETNRYNLLDEPYFYDAARALLGPERRQFLDEYKFNVAPATDDQPYFFQFFKWRSLPEIFKLRARGGMPLLEWGYLVLVATLIQALIASAVLILLPLLALRRRRVRRDAAYKGSVLVYFSAIGLAFLFVEMAFIQRFILFLHHPLYATSVVLSGFLVFAGLGSAFARRVAQADRQRLGVGIAVFGIAIVSAIYLLVLGPLFAQLMAWPIAAKIAATLLLIMPLAFCMGLPFPLALDRLARDTPELIPWAWGVNGCASVISAVLATLLAIQFGFHAVILSAIALYAIAALALPRRGAEKFQPTDTLEQTAAARIRLNRGTGPI